jgi:ribosomal protein L16 Arg81 hydroxylase
MNSFPVLGDISAEEFLAEYWQKKTAADSQRYT